MSDRKESDYAVLTNQYSFHTEIAPKSLLKAGVLK